MLKHRVNMVKANRPWSVSKRFAAALRLLFVFSLLSLTVLPLSTAFAVPAGTVISNVANAQFTSAGTPITVSSNTLNITSTGSLASGPTPGVLLTKTAGKTSVSIGDVLQYKLHFDNTGSGLNLTGVFITDSLPVGLRYKAGSTKVNGVSASDPTVSSNGQTLVFTLGNVAAGRVIDVLYVVEVTPGANKDKLTNVAVTNAAGGVSSNRAEVSVQVRQDFFTDAAFLEGRVIIDSCDPQGKQGLKGARIYLENGTYVVTDEEGKWHIEGVKPGTHIVQLDKFSLPEEYEPILCEDNSRHADTAFSQFVDVKGGTLWRADFYLRTKPNIDFFAPFKRVHFDFDKDQVKSEDEALVQQIARKVAGTDNSIYVDGHTDSIGTDQYNMDLSVRRAETITEKLAAYGVDEDQIQIQAFSFNEPADDNKLTQGRATNRRVDVSKNPEAYDRVLIAQGKLDDQEEQFDPKKYDAPWLEMQSSSFNWVYPDAQYNPATPGVPVGVKHKPTYNVSLFINGEKVSALNYDGSVKSTSGKVMLSRWTGVDLKPGDNLLEAVLLHSSGAEMNRIQMNVHYSGDPENAELIAKKSILIADGKQAPIVAVRITDKGGYPARPGSVGFFTVEAPYRSEESVADQIDGRIIRSARESRFFVGKDGIALLKLQPTTESGEARILIKVSDNKNEEVRAWLSPGPRDWIFVGLAEGLVGDHMVDGNQAALAAADLAEGNYNEGRAAFFAKGQIKGEWLLTAAYDSDKDKNERFRQIIDPDTYYTLYGDNTAQAYDAASTKKLYLKIEKKDFYAMFGDYDTGLDKVELGKYNRSVTGLKTESQNERWKTSFFATESGQSFLRDEIRGDGTSGLYKLSRKDIVSNSDKISIETRDRFRSEKIIETESLIRHIDYNIDYSSGTVYFRKPISANDGQQNPIYIVAEYESTAASDQDITAGGRAAYHLSDKTYVGVTAIHEGNTGAKADLTGFDTSIALNETIVLKTEYATSEKEKTGTSVDGSAYIVEVTHDGTKLDTSVYIREQDENFGLGQQSSGEKGTRKTGVDARYTVDNSHTINSEIYQQDDLINKATRRVVDTTYDYEKDNSHGYVGGRYSDDSYNTGENFGSSQFLLGGNTGLLDNKLNVRADSEWMIQNTGDEENPDFPNRIQLGLDYHLTKSVDAIFDQEFAWGEKQDYQGSSVGLRVRPWTGMETTTAVGKQNGEYGDRTFANMGLTQNIAITEQWHMDFSADRSQTISQSGDVYPTASFNIDNTEDFTAFTVGGGYLTKTREWSTRVETRASDSEDKINVFMGFLQQLDQGVAMSLGLALSEADRDNNETANSGDLRYSIAYRPVSSAWHYFNRLDYLWDETTNSNTSYRNRRLVNNFMANYKPDLINQLSLQYGGKYSLDNIGDTEYNNYTDLYGFEFRRNMPKFKGMNTDIGLHGHSLNNWDAGIHEYSWGVSGGFSPEKNMWLSLGYNFEGFIDEDFSGSEYTAKGFYLKFRLKVDQESLRDLWAKK